MCHLAMSVKKENNIKVKISNGEQSIKTFDIQINTMKQVIEFLKVYE